ncbi:MAG: ABC transporter permease [Bryobacteraceae bacterium]
MAWKGDIYFLIRSLVLKDFRVRYRNASLGLFWSLLNPLVMMTVYWFVFTKIFRNSVPNFPVFVLCGIVPFNFLAVSWSTATNSLVENANIVKRVPIPLEVVPISTVLGNVMHLLIQMSLIIVFVFAAGLTWNVYWFWLPALWVMEIVFVCGLALASSCINVYIRDTRYIVESAVTVLFWLVPIFYPFSFVRPEYREIYQFNPVAALVLAMRNVILESKAPPPSLVWKLALVSTASLVIGLGLFRLIRKRLSDQL